MTGLKPAGIVRLHEELLFRRAYPCAEKDAVEADRGLIGLGAEVQARRESGSNLTELEEAEQAGIAGSGITAVFSYGVARHLVKAHGENVRIAWEAYEAEESFGRLLPEMLPLCDEDAQVEAHVPYREWVSAAARGRSEIGWLVKALARRFGNEREEAVRYDALQLPLRWEFGQGSASRTLMRLPCKRMYYHEGPLIERREVSLDEIPALPKLAARRLTRHCGRTVLALARDTSAVRYRELHGFSWGDPDHVYDIGAGRGVRFFLSGVVPGWRLPLRAYHAMSLWKNGVPIGYFEGLSLFERMEAGFNLYYTFRAGETAWLYARILQAMREMLGVTTFVIDPYQMGHENAEGLESGAFWFYRKLGFRSTDGEIRALTEREEKRLKKAGGRTGTATLRRLVREPMIYAFPGEDSGEWDGFRLRRLGLKTAGGRGLAVPAELAGLKGGAEEAGYLRAMRKDGDFRRRVLAMGGC